MTSRIDYKLKEWGAWMEKTLDWADLLGENILHRAGILSGRVQEGSSGHKVLCPDCPPSVRKTDRAVSRLNDKDRDSLVLWYCLPVKDEDGKPFTKQEIATSLGISKDAYSKRLTRSRKKVLELLDNCINIQ